MRIVVCYKYTLCDTSYLLQTSFKKFTFQVQKNNYSSLTCGSNRKPYKTSGSGLDIMYWTATHNKAQKN